MKLKLRLQTKILTPIFAVLILSNLLIIYFVNKSTKDAVISQIENNVTTTNHAITRAVQDFNKQELNLIHTVASLPDLVNPAFPMSMRQVIVKTIFDAQDKEYFKTGFIDVNGQSYDLETQSPVDMSEEIMYTTAIKGQQYVSNPFYNEDGEMRIRFAGPVYDQSGKIFGVLYTESDGWIICDLASVAQASPNTNTSIFDRVTGYVIGSEKRTTVDFKYNNFRAVAKNGAASGLTQEFIDTVTVALNGESGCSQYSVQGVEMIVAYEPIEGTTWSVMSPAPYMDFSALLIQLRARIMFIIIFLLVFTLVVGIILITSLLRPLKKVTNAVNDLSSGNADLTKRLPILTADEIGNVVSGVNNFTDKLHGIVSEVTASKEYLNEAGGELSDICQDTSDSISQIIEQIDAVNTTIGNQTRSVEQTAGAVNEIASNIESLERMIETQTAGVTEASAAVEQMIGNIRSVNTSVEKMAQSFAELEENTQTGAAKQDEVNRQIELIESQSETLQEANTAIAAIAEQTNLLAMNAAIEAAHAGEAGKGFSVVADEIRKLSETSTTQSKTIGEQLSSIQELINSVVLASQESSHAFETVTGKIHETDQLVHQIRSAMEEQEQGSQQIGTALHSMNDSTIEVRSASQEMSEGNKAILEEVRLLQEATGSMQESVVRMGNGARKVKETGVALSEIVDKMKGSITQIGTQIDQFKI